MTLYIRADEDLQWFNGSMMITSGTNRRTISYHNGRADAAQNGGSVIIPGRVSVLTISNSQQSDSGTYSCRILGTEQSADIQLNVMSTQQTTLPGATSPVTTPTGPGTAATHSTTTLPSSIVALQLSVIPIQQSTLQLLLPQLLLLQVQLLLLQVQVQGLVQLIPQQLFLLVLQQFSL